MTNLATLRGGGGEEGSTNKSRLPVFAVYSNYNNSPHYSIYDGMGHTIGSGTMTTNGEIWSSYTSVNYTNGNPSSSGYSTYSTGFTCLQQAEGHYAQNLPNTGGYQVLTQKNASQVANTWSRFGVTINEEGIRQKNSLFVNNASAQVYPFGSRTAVETVTWTSYANTSGTPGSTSTGMISYNDRTKTLVIVVGSGSATYRIHVWKHPNYGLDGTDFASGSLLKFMNDARNNLNGASYFYNDFTWSTSASTSYNESLYHMRVIVGDNNVVGLVRFTPSNQTVYGYLTLNSGSTSTSVTTGNTMSVTTSYGIDNGNLYGMRHQTTWDNKWVVAYAPYYYYGCGAKMYFVYTPNPAIYYMYQYDDTSNGVGIAPIQENKFIWAYHSANNDGEVGMQAGTFSPEQFRERNVVSGTSLSGITNGGWLDTRYTSTNYSYIFPMASWSSGVDKA